MELEQIKELIKQFETGKAKKLSLRKGDFELTLEKESDLSKVAATFLPPTYHPPAVVRSEQHSASEPVRGEVSSSNKYIVSPMVGTFYAAPAPGQPSFIKVGDQVEETTVVCVVEAMKVMNEVKAGVSGTVSEILIDNAHPVEFGTKIFSVI
jgi:acetyl-CoA carboxylase biotin carboxyl carrier protein